MEQADSMVTRQTVEDVLYERLAEGRHGSESAVRAEVGANGEIDSLEGVELVAAAEERFGIHIADNELCSSLCRSVPRLAKLIASKCDG